MSAQPPAQERHLIIVRLPAGALPGFPPNSWLLVGDVREEAAARTAFHEAKAALDHLHGAGLLARAVVTEQPRAIGPLKVLASTNIDQWRLRSEDVRRVTVEQRRAWDACVREFAKRPATKGADAARPAKAPPVLLRPAVIGAAAALAVFVGAGIVELMQPEPPAPMDARIALAREGRMTVTLPDPSDPKLMIEYLLHPDGTREIVRRIPQSSLTAVRQREEQAAMRGAQAEQGTVHPKPKSLADGMSFFSRIRE